MSQESESRKEKLKEAKVKVKQVVDRLIQEAKKDKE